MFSLLNYFEYLLEIGINNCISSEARIIADRYVHLHSNNDELKAKMLVALEHLKVSHSAQKDLDIYYLIDEGLPNGVKAPDFTQLEFNSQGYCEELENGSYSIFFQPWLKQLFIYSYDQKIGIYWAKSIEDIPWWDTTFPFRIIFHWWTRDLPCQLLHSGAILDQYNQCWLITGPSGAGKSSTTISLTLEGNKYIGDDYVWIEKNNENYKVYSLYQTAKLNVDNYNLRFSHLRSYVSNYSMLAKQKAIIMMWESFPESVEKVGDLKGILVPHLTIDKKSMIKEASKSTTLISMAATTLHHLPHNRQHSFQKFKQLTNYSACYDYLIKTDDFSYIKEFDTFSLLNQNNG